MGAIANKYKLNYRLQLLGIFAFAWLLRAIHVHYIYYSPFSDMPSYLDMAEQVFGGSLMANKTLFPPGYPFLIYVVFKLVGSWESMKPLLQMQALMDAAVILPLAYIARSLFNARVALVAALAYALYHPAIQSAGLAMSETLGSFLLFLSLAAFISFTRRMTWLRCLLCVLATAAFIHVRTNGTVLLPVFFAFTIIRKNVAAMGWRRILPQFGGRQRALFASTLVLGTLLLLVPWCYRNSRILGHPAFLATNTGLNLFQGNNPLSAGGWVPWEFPKWYSEPIDRATGDNVYPVMEQLANDFVHQYPATEIFYILPMRIRIYFDEVFGQLYPWDDGHFGGNFYTDPFGPGICVPLLSFTPIAVIGLLGLMYRGRRLPWFLLVTWIAMFAVVLIPAAAPRYRSLFDGLLVISAAPVLVRAAPRRQWTRVWMSALVALSIIVAVGTCVKLMKYSGENQLNSAAFTPVAGTLHPMIRGTYARDFATTEPRYPITEDIGSLSVSPGVESHLLFGFRYKVRVQKDSPEPTAVNIAMQFKDERGQPVTNPFAQNQMLTNHMTISTLQSRGGYAWRVVRIPAFARAMNLQLVINVPCQVELSDFEIHGPAWFALPAASGNSKSSQGA